MREMNSKEITVALVDGTKIKGKVNIGTSRRLSDYFNRHESLFIVIFDVSMEGRTSEVVFVNRNHIVWVKPEEEPLSLKNIGGDLSISVDRQSSD